MTVAKFPAPIGISRYKSLRKIRVEFIRKEPWFLESDIRSVFKIRNVPRGLNKSDVRKLKIFHAGLRREVNFISEAGFYHVIFLSRKRKLKKYGRYLLNTLVDLRKGGVQ